MARGDGEEDALAFDGKSQGNNEMVDGERRGGDERVDDDNRGRGVQRQ